MTKEERIEGIRKTYEEFGEVSDWDNVGFLIEEIDRLNEKLKEVLPIVEAAFWDQHTAGTLPGSGYTHKPQHEAGIVFGWRTPDKFLEWKKSLQPEDKQEKVKDE